LGVPHIVGKFVGGTVCPPSLIGKTIISKLLFFQSCFRDDDTGRPDKTANAMSASACRIRIDIRCPSNHGFIQLFELQVSNPAPAA
jgi:hypothetical protein